MKNSELVFGKISNDRQFGKKNFGFAECRLASGALLSVFLHFSRCRKVVADDSGKPVFSDQPSRDYPREGKEIVAVILLEEKPVDGKAWPAAYWGYKTEWDAVANSPWYRVIVNARRFKEKFERIIPGTQITVEGKMEFLQQKYPRLPDGKNDRLGPVYRSNPVTEWQCWQRFVKTDESGKDIYELCADPRSLPLIAQTAPKAVTVVVSVPEEKGNDNGGNSDSLTKTMEKLSELPLDERAGRLGSFLQAVTQPDEGSSGVDCRRDFRTGSA